MKDEVFRNYTFGFMFVRDPFQRALSAYYNKVRKENYFGGRDWSLNRYFDYLVQNSMQDPHFKTQVEVCDPCFLGINYLGRTETMNNDLHQLVNVRTTLHKEIQFSIQKAENSSIVLKKTKYNSMNRTYQKLDRYLILQFVWKYRMDYLAFGYNPYTILSKLS